MLSFKKMKKIFFNQLFKYKTKESKFIFIQDQIKYWNSVKDCLIFGCHDKKVIDKFIDRILIPQYQINR